jgi:NADPH:quinone reductase-like Zn-dependent oxidoreductase
LFEWKIYGMLGTLFQQLTRRIVVLNSVEQSLFTSLPDNVTYTQGSVFPLTFFTASVMLLQDNTLALECLSLENEHVVWS